MRITSRKGTMAQRTKRGEMVAGMVMTTVLIVMVIVTVMPVVVMMGTVMVLVVGRQMVMIVVVMVVTVMPMVVVVTGTVTVVVMETETVVVVFMVFIYVNGLAEKASGPSLDSTDKNQLRIPIQPEHNKSYVYHIHKMGTMSPYSQAYFCTLCELTPIAELEEIKG